MTTAGTLVLTAADAVGAGCETAFYLHDTAHAADLVGQLAAIMAAAPTDAQLVTQVAVDALTPTAGTAIRDAAELTFQVGTTMRLVRIIVPGFLPALYNSGSTAVDVAAVTAAAPDLAGYLGDKEGNGGLVLMRGRKCTLRVPIWPK